MTEPSPEEIRRWSEEVARDPGSLAFVPLAEAYRRQGKLDAALRLCLRGLGKHPSNVEAHAVLARIYLERGDREKAGDEWHAIAALDPEHFEACRGLGFAHLERGEPEEAARLLEKAAEARPDDRSVREALALARERRAGAGEPAEGRGAGAPVEPAGGGAPSPPEEAEPAGGMRADAPPREVFGPLLGSPNLLGILLVDADGLVVAGKLSGEEAGRADEVAAVLSGAIEEARRTAEHLKLGAWEGILLEAEGARAYLAPVGGSLLLVAGEGEAPVGWLKRISGDAGELAEAFLGA